MRCQWLCFDQQLTRLWLSHQFLLEVFGFAHTCLTRMPHRFSTHLTLGWSIPSFFFVGWKFHLHSSAAVIISRRNSWGAQSRLNMSADGEFSERLLSAALLGWEMYLWLLSVGLPPSCCLPVSFNKKPSAVLGQLRLFPVVPQTSAPRC